MFTTACPLCGQPATPIERGLAKQVASRWLNERAAAGHSNRHVQTVLRVCAVGFEAFQRSNDIKRCTNRECRHVFR